jgi:dipeptidyl aminopeptidase/acylaminoacyl peptidase
MRNMTKPVATRPYGSWSSPITAELIVAETVSFGGVWLDGDDVYWSELRPAEGGRNAIVRRTAHGDVQELLPVPFNARTRVNEYGGGAVAVADGIVYFAHDTDQRVYRLVPGSMPVPITPPDTRRYADLFVDRAHGRVLAVCEDHRASGEPVQSIVAVDASGADVPRTLASGHDFFAAPRLSRDGRELAFLAWDHPNMPWDGTELYLADCEDDGAVRDARLVAGGPDESICQPAFAPDGTLYFVSDRSGWWNLYRCRDGEVEPLLPLSAEFGGPHWVFGLARYGFTSPHSIVCAFNDCGSWRLGTLDVRTRQWRMFPTDYTDISYVQSDGQHTVFIGAGPTTLPEIVRLDLPSERYDVIRRSAVVSIDPGFISIPRAIEYETSGGELAHAFFYAPRNCDAIAPANERPPLLVFIHGGPTSATTTALNLKIQYWTSRGFAVLDVNYRGSTGFGRAYRHRLDGAWGVADVDDCAYGARHLVEQGGVDGARLAIRGGSAGGFTTLCALAFHEEFKAGAVYYGVSDLETLAHDTHKFESRYLDRLIGPYPAEKARYIERSPLHHADQIVCPVIFFQGLEDRVVPPSQTNRLVQALRQRGVRVAYVGFPGEQHGFRMAHNVKRTLETELYFYGRVFGFDTDSDKSVADPFV